MNEDIYRLVYYSRNSILCDPSVQTNEIDEILEKSRLNNLRDRITGALMFNAGCFAQVLEGPLHKIESTFERIQQDPRHGDVSLLALEPIPQRSFPGWAMGFVGKSVDYASRFAAIAEQTGFTIERMTGEQIHSILMDLAIDEERSAA